MDGNEPTLLETFEHTANGTLRIDAERYMHMLEDSDLTEAQKQVVLEELLKIIVTVVELSFGVHPLQEVCGKPDNLSDEWSAVSVDALECENNSEDKNEKDAPEAE